MNPAFPHTMEPTADRQAAIARAELLRALEDLLKGPQPLTRARLERWELFGNAVREYLRAEELSDAQAAP